MYFLHTLMKSKRTTKAVVVVTTFWFFHFFTYPIVEKYHRVVPNTVEYTHNREKELLCVVRCSYRCFVVVLQQTSQQTASIAWCYNRTTSCAWSFLRYDCLCCPQIVHHINGSLTKCGRKLKPFCMEVFEKLLITFLFINRI